VGAGLPQNQARQKMSIKAIVILTLASLFLCSCFSEPVRIILIPATQGWAGLLATFLIIWVLFGMLWGHVKEFFAPTPEPPPIVEGYSPEDSAACCRNGGCDVDCLELQ